MQFKATFVLAALASLGMAMPYNGTTTATHPAPSGSFPHSYKTKNAGWNSTSVSHGNVKPSWNSTVFPFHNRSKRDDWTSTPSDGQFSTAGFGGRTSTTGGTDDTYCGNVGNPWGSNMIEVSESDASQYKYVMQLKGQNTDSWTIVFWNKFGSSGQQDGQYGQNALTVTLNSGETKYVAFDENSQGAFGAIGGGSLTKSSMGAYSVTYGEFDFGNQENNEWSGFDVSIIQAQMAGAEVQGMQMCEAQSGTCSSVSGGGSSVNNAYTQAEVAAGGIGGNLPAGPVRLAVVIDYSG